MRTNDTATKPAALAVKANGIPPELRSRPQWVCWRFAWRDGKWTKEPINPHSGTLASSTDAATWGTITESLAHMERHGLPGIGFVFAVNDPYAGVDLDTCRDPLTNRVQPWAEAIVRDLASYTELSPSETGLHIIVKAIKPAGSNSRRGRIEIYDRRRFFTFTGHQLDGAPAAIADRQPEFDALIARVFGSKEEPASARGAGSSSLTDDAVIEKARTARNGGKFMALWAGDVSDYASESEADLGLLSRLAFYTQDPGQLDRLFRRSGLMRDKWERADYRARTIARAIQQRETWEPPGTTPNRNRRAPGDDAATDAASEPPAVEPFPDHILPPAVRRYCVSAAQSLGEDVPVEMVAAPLLAFTGALAGNRVYLAVKKSWTERGGLTVAIVGRPGTIKSPALRHANWPIKALQDDAYAVHERVMAQFKRDHAAWKKNPTGDEPERPRLREYFTSDTTMEALAELLGRNPGICIIVDELRGWVLGFDKYRAKGGNDRQQTLSLWGSESIKVNRKTGDPLYVSAPVASVAGGLQPDFAGAFQAGKNATDGFVERLLPVVCDHGAQAWTDDAITTEHYTAVADLFRLIDRLATPDRQEGKPAGIGIELSNEARRLWVEFFNDNCRRVNAASGLEAGMLQKLSTHTARFALILHLLWHAGDPRVMVSEQTMADAIELSDWWRGHINRYLWLLGKHAANSAEPPLHTRILRILRKDRGDDHDDWVMRSAIYRELGNIPAEAMAAALAELLAAGKVERRQLLTATKPIEEWRIATDNSQYSQYSGDAGHSGKATQENANNANGANNRGGAPTPLYPDDGEWEEWAV